MLLTLLIVSFVGCVETKPSGRPYPKDPYYKQVMRNWRGYSLNDLVRQLGPPSQTYSTNDTKFVIYRNRMRYATSYTVPYMRASGLNWQIDYCVYTFELSKKDIIRRVTAEGWICPLYHDELKNGVIPGVTRPK